MTGTAASAMLPRPRPMRLLFALHDWFPFGGLERDCVRIAVRCAALGHEVAIAARTWDGPKPEGVRVHELGRRGLTIPARNRAFVRAVQALRAQHGHDGLVGFQKMPGLDVYYGADPCYAAGIYQKPRWKRWLPRHRHYLRSERAVFAPEHGVVALQYIDRDVPAYMAAYGTARSQFVVLPPNAEPTPYTAADRAAARAEIRRELGAGPDDPVLLCLGSAFARKGFDRAIDALADLPGPTRASAHLAVVGRDDPAALLARARRRGLADHVHCLGGRNDAPKWLLGSDLLLHAARRENTGSVLVEALHFGLPVIATARCGYAPHVAAAGAGVVLSDPFSAGDLAAAVQQGLDPARRADWQRRALAHAATGALYGCHDAAAAAIVAAVAARLRRPGAPA